MLYKVILFLVITSIAAIKKPIYGGIAGMIAAPAIYYIFNTFDLPTILVLSAFGFGVGLLWGVFSWNFFHGKEYNQQNEKTYIMPITHRGSGGEEVESSIQMKKKKMPGKMRGPDNQI